MESHSSLVNFTAHIVASYLQQNRLESERVGELIRTVHLTLVELNGGAEVKPAETLTPAVSIKKSVNASRIVCLEDGLEFQSLKRHLRSAHNMTPEEYRARWSLPADYPMVAPNYARARSALAKRIGLGSNRRDSEEDAADDE